MVDEDDELWSVGQHHDLMTPLLDWTYPQGVREQVVEQVLALAKLTDGGDSA